MLGDKNVSGIVKPLAQVADRIIVTQSESPRAIDAFELGELVRDAVGEERAQALRVEVVDRAEDALVMARAEAAAASEDAVEGRVARTAGVLVTGSVTLIGEAAVLADAEGWKSQPATAESAQNDAVPEGGLGEGMEF